MNEDTFLLARYREQEDESALKFLIDRHLKKVFTFIFFLLGGDSNKAHEVTRSCFIEVVRADSPKKGEIFFLGLLRTALAKLRDSKTAPSPSSYYLEDSFRETPGSLRIVRQALFMLPIGIRAKLLLRDQLHLLYEDISLIYGISKQALKSQMRQARSQLREKLQEILDRSR